MKVSVTKTWIGVLCFLVLWTANTSAFMDPALSVNLARYGSMLSAAASPAFPCMTSPADLNTDCVVDLSDLVLLADQWLGSCSGYCADIDQANGINLGDFSLLADQWGQSGKTVVIHEFLASSTLTEPSEPWQILDEDGQSSDWIEIRNLSASAVSLNGWFLTDDASIPTKWMFPSMTIPAEGYQMVFASGKNRSIPSGELHTNFQLDKDGEYLALIRPDGTVEHEYRSRYPSQATNVSYGLTAAAGADRYLQAYFQTPTPGDDNSAGVVGAIQENVDFSVIGGMIATPFDLTLSHSVSAADIYYTLDGTEPTTASTRYTAPISISISTCVRARAIEPGKIPGPIKSQSYILIDTGLQGFSSDIPVMVIDNFGQGSLGDFNPQTEGPWIASLIAVCDKSADGRSRFTVAPSVYSRGGARVRGTSSSSYPKQGFALEIWDEKNEDKDIAMLGMPADSDWVLYAPYYFDRALVRNAFIYELSNQAGRYAPRTRFVELFVNTNNGILDYNDYMGVYVLMEKIKRGSDRVDVEKMDLSDNASPEVTGGYIIKNDWVKADELRWYTDRNLPTSQGSTSYLESGLTVASPEPEDLTATQYAYIKDYFQQCEDAIFGQGGIHYSELIDVDSWADHNLLNMLAKNVDALRLSAYFHKDREGKFQAGPIWDFDRSMDSYDDRDNAFDTWKGTGDGTDYFGYDWWGPLFQDDDFRLRYADRWFALREKALRPANINSIIDSMAAQLQEAQQRNFARWSSVAPSSWQGQIDHLKDWLTNRINWIDNRMAIEFAPVPPTILLNGAAANTGGHVSAGDAVTFSNPSGSGSIYYTLDGTDPIASVPSYVVLLEEDAAKSVLVPSAANGGDSLYQFAAPFNVVLYKANIPVTSLSIANSIIDTLAYRQSVHAETASVINYLETGGDGHYSGNNVFPGLSAGENSADFVVVATGYVQIDQAGDWTFGVSSDDGFSCELVNDFRTYAFSFPQPRAAADTLHTFNIDMPGLYRVRLVYYENGGGAEVEFFAAKGSYAAFNANAFRLVGDTANGGLTTYGTWIDPAFDDSAWTQGTGGVGYERNPGDLVNYTDLISTDVQAAMYGNTASCFLRIPFNIEDVSEVDLLEMDVRYDDGYIAYLNGFKVAEVHYDNAVPPAWNSKASDFHDDTPARQLETVDLTPHINKLQGGRNILAVHGLNESAASSDFLFSAKLRQTGTSGYVPSPSAVEYVSPVLLNESVEIQTRALENGQWSALNEAVFAVGPVAQSLRITEVMYHPADPNTEYLELMNVGDETISLNLVQFSDGIEFMFPSTFLDPSERVVIVESRPEFEAQYGTSLNIAGQYVGSLDNAGEKIVLEDALGSEIHNFEYKDSWYDITDGQGFSLTIKNPLSTDPNLWETKTGWRPSAMNGGSPGQSDSGMIPDSGDVVINEVLAHSDTAYDWIELHNTTDQAVNIGGWFLSDSNNDNPERMKYEIAAGQTIDPNGYLVFYENLHFGNPADAGCHIPFQLSENGESVYLQSGRDGVLTGYFEQEDFGASDRDIAFGRFEKSDGGINFVAMASNTPGETNAYPKVGPIVMTEIMYHPANHPDAEYVELLNITSSPVTLYDFSTNEPWRFVDDKDNLGIEYYFPAHTPVTMAPHSMILLIKNATAFKSEFGPDSLDGIAYFEWLSGSLSNGEEKPELQMPGDVNASGQRVYIRVDRVSYDDVAPWPVEADGTGQSLHHKTPTTTGGNYSNDPDNWHSAIPTPGLND